MFTVKRAAELTGLTPATLRVWEQRYGVGPSDRTAAGYRLYDDRAIGRLRAMKALVDAGTSPREAALRLAEDGERSDATDPAGAVDALGLPCVHRAAGRPGERCRRVPRRDLRRRLSSRLPFVCDESRTRGHER